MKIYRTSENVYYTKLPMASIRAMHMAAQYE